MRLLCVRTHMFLRKNVITFFACQTHNIWQTIVVYKSDIFCCTHFLLCILDSMWNEWIVWGRWWLVVITFLYAPLQIFLLNKIYTNTPVPQGVGGQNFVVTFTTYDIINTMDTARYSSTYHSSNFTGNTFCVTIIKRHITSIFVSGVVYVLVNFVCNISD